MIEHYLNIIDKIKIINSQAKESDEYFQFKKRTKCWVHL